MIYFFLLLKFRLNWIFRDLLKLEKSRYQFKIKLSLSTYDNERKLLNIEKFVEFNWIKILCKFNDFFYRFYFFSFHETFTERRFWYINAKSSCSKRCLSFVVGILCKLPGWDLKRTPRQRRRVWTKKKRVLMA